MLIDAKDEHEKKACSPIVVTESGIKIDVNEERPLKASLPIAVTVGCTVTTVTSFGARSSLLRRSK